MSDPRVGAWAAWRDAAGEVVSAQCVDIVHDADGWQAVFKRGEDEYRVPLPNYRAVN